MRRQEIATGPYFRLARTNALSAAVSILVAVAANSVAQRAIYAKQAKLQARNAAHFAFLACPELRGGERITLRREGRPRITTSARAIAERFSLSHKTVYRLRELGLSGTAARPAIRCQKCGLRQFIMASSACRRCENRLPIALNTEKGLAVHSSSGTSGEGLILLCTANSAGRHA